MSLLKKISQCVYYVYTNRVPYHLGKEVCDKSDIGGEERGDDNANLADVNKEVKEEEQGVNDNDNEYKAGVKHAAYGGIRV